MATKLKERETIRGFGPGTVSDQIRNHDNDPYVVKKVEKAAETLKRVGLPGQEKK
jgi:hypothetical protein